MRSLNITISGVESLGEAVELLQREIDGTFMEFEIRDSEEGDILYASWGSVEVLE